MIPAKNVVPVDLLAPIDPSVGGIRKKRIEKGSSFSVALYLYYVVMSTINLTRSCPCSPTRIPQTAIGQ